MAAFGDLGEIVGLRRARIGAEGELAIGGHYVTEIDLAAGEVVLRDIFAGLGDIQRAGEFRVGHQFEPFSLELGTSDNVYAFMERSPVNALDPERSWGLTYFQNRWNDSSLLALGIYQSGNDLNDFQGGDGSAVACTQRLTAAPINENDGERLLHVGAALSERIPETGVALINQQPRSTLIDFVDSARSPFVPRLRIPADFQQLLNLQFASVVGPCWLQAEWYGSWIDQRGAGPIFFHGCHADCGYFLTGEHRQYLGGSGAFGPVKVNGPVFRRRSARDRPRGWGAWELTARYAYLNFRDSDTPTGSNGELLGIQFSQSTIGVNWYLADQLRVLFNYSYALPDELNSGTSPAGVFATRLALFW